MPEIISTTYHRPRNAKNLEIWARYLIPPCTSRRPRQGDRMQSPLHSTIIVVYNAWQHAQVCTRPVHGPQTRFARGLLARARLLCWSRGGRRPLRLRVPEANVLRQGAWHAAAATPRLLWTPLSSRSGPEETM